MDSKTKKQLKEYILNGQTQLALTLLESVKVDTAKRTEKQNASYWLWLTMIEKEAENQGVTWDLVLRHVNQLRVTKENVHEAVKQLTKALWGITSTTQLEKQGHLDTIIDHVTDLFGKAGLEVPPFPEERNKPTTIANLDTAKKIQEKYYDDNYEPTIL